MTLDPTKPENFQDKIVTIMGLGRFKQGSGIGSAKWLLRHGAQLVITDLKNDEELRASVEEVSAWYDTYKKDYPDRDIYPPLFVLGEHREEDFTEVDMVVKNPGVPTESKYVKLAQEKGVRIESDVSLFFHMYPDEVYIVTGTRGKSTTASMIHEILKKKHPKAIVAGNIAVSPLEHLEELMQTEDREPIVLELSSWLIDSLTHIDRGPDIAVLTNIYEDHLDRYNNDFDLYKKSKAALFEKQNESQVGVFNLDHPVVVEVAEMVKSKKYWFSANPLPEGKEGAYVDGGVIKTNIGGTITEIMPVADMKLQGAHNVSNALAAAIVSIIAKEQIPPELVAEALREFEGLAGRQQLVREIKGRSFINDTTATSPDGAIAALQHFHTSLERKDIVLLAGGSSKNLSFDTLADMIKQTCKFVVLLPGTATPDLAKAIGDAVPSQQVETMEEAVKLAAEKSEPDDIVLLSPGTASFGAFKNEFDRGGQFVDYVKALQEKDLSGESTVTA